MQILINCVAPLITSETSGPSQGMAQASAHAANTGGRHAVVYRVTLDEKTGRFEKR